MGRPRQGTFSTITLNLDRREVDKFESNLPRGTSLSEIVREFIHDENERIENEKDRKSTRLNSSH